MRMNAVWSPVMEPVRGRAVAPVAWTLAWTNAPARARRAGAAVTWPLWVAIVVVLDGFVHHDGTVVVRLTRTNPWPATGMFARGTGSALLVGAVLGTTAGQASFAPTVASVGVAVVIHGWCAAAVLLLAVAAARTGLAVARAQRTALRAASREQRRADVARFRAADWTVDSVASRERGGALALISRHVGEVVGPHETVRTLAATTRHAAVYRRFGLEPLPSRPLMLVGAAPAH
ncbi:hypothetical protein ACFQ80_00470 [Isoptericola sp. NPDC056578]|uniref:hypothetical protein n=1 Tax=Isoptericola sp. NPDC056578 TaxID=3345870 RepID=UPI0036A3CDF1